MATLRCTIDPTHEAAWICSCSPSSSFCSLCLLVHLSGAGPHSVTAVESADQQVCTVCVQRRGEGPVCRECAGRMAQRQADSPLQRLLIERKADIEGHLRQALHNFTSFEEILHESLQAEHQLKATEDRLAQSREEVLRLSARLEHVEEAGLGRYRDMLERIETQNAEIRSENQRLAAEHASLSQQFSLLAGQFRHSPAQRTLRFDPSSQLNLLQRIAEDLADADLSTKTDTVRTAFQGDDPSSDKMLTELTWEAQTTYQCAKLQDYGGSLCKKMETMAERVCSVMPLLSVEEAWRDPIEAEEAFGIALKLARADIELGVVRKLVRVFAQIAKIFEHCECFSLLSTEVFKTLKIKPEGSISLVSSLASLIQAYRTESEGKPALEGMISLLKADTALFWTSVELLSQFQERPGLNPLCQFSVPYTNFFCKESQHRKEWLEVLQALPLEEETSPCLRDYLLTVASHQFHPRYIKVVGILSPVPTPAALQFMPIALKGLTNQTPEYEILVERLTAIVGRRQPRTTEVTFIVLSKLLPENSAERLQLLQQFLSGLETQSEYIKPAAALAALLSNISDIGLAAVLGWTVIAWLRLRDNYESAERLLVDLHSSSPTLAEVGITNVTKLMNVLTRRPSRSLEIGFATLLQSISLANACEFCTVLLSKLSNDTVDIDLIFAQFFSQIETFEENWVATATQLISSPETEQLVLILSISAKTFTDTVSVLDRFRTIMSTDEFLHFAVATCDSFVKNSTRCEAWISGLLSIPIDRYLKSTDTAKNFIHDYLLTIAGQHFEERFLPISSLLRSDQLFESLHYFLQTALFGLCDSNLCQEHERLSRHFAEFIDYAGSESEVVQSAIGILTKLFNSSTNAQGIAYLGVCCCALRNHQYHSPAKALNRLLEAMPNTNYFGMFAWAAICWLLPNGEVRENVAYAETVLKTIESSCGVLADNEWEQAIRLLTELGKTQCVGIEATFVNLAPMVPFHATCELCITLLSDLSSLEAHLDWFWQILLELCKIDNPDWVSLASQLISIKQTQPLLTGLGCYLGLVSASTPLLTASAQMKELLSSLKLDRDRPVALEAIYTLSTLLTSESPGITVCMEALALWMKRRDNPSGNSCALSFLRAMLASLNVPTLPQDYSRLIRIIEFILRTESQYGAAFKLGELFLYIPVEDTQPCEILLTTLATLVGLAEPITAFLESLVEECLLRQLTPSETAMFIAVVRKLCVSLAVAQVMPSIELLLEAPQLELMRSLPALGFDHAFDVIWIACRHDPRHVFRALMELSSLIVLARNSGCTFPSLSDRFKADFTVRMDDIQQVAVTLRAMLEKQPNLERVIPALFDALLVTSSSIVAQLRFVPEFACHLVEGGANASSVSRFCENLLQSFSNDPEVALFASVQSLWSQEAAAKLSTEVALSSGDITLAAVALSIVQRSSQNLAHLQANAIRLFSIERSSWCAKLPLRADKEIVVSEDSRYTFLNERELIYCGGRAHVRR